MVRNRVFVVLVWDVGGNLVVVPNKRVRWDLSMKDIYKYIEQNLFDGFIDDCSFSMI
jgi:hypothetical protein